MINSVAWKSVKMRFFVKCVLSLEPLSSMGCKWLEYVLVVFSIYLYIYEYLC